ncbi:LexA family protein [Rubrivirga sp.]|uniref:LexA family protein n=1 Tax=Rubrivirga sp. TaxID=1885344 RepID=UPI003B519BFB
MRDRLTERQNQVYEFLRTYVRRSGKPPTIKEIGAHLDIKSTNGVHKMLVVLETKGYINRTKHEARGIEIVDDVGYADDEPPGVLMLKLKEGVGRRARPLTSETADHPLPRSRRPLLLDPSLVPDDVDLDDCLGVVASDDGMNGAGVRKGDLVVVEEMDWRDVPNGALAAVLFFDHVVIRRFEFVNERLHFRAADRTYADESARPDDAEFFVVGRALAMMRELA